MTNIGKKSGHLIKTLLGLGTKTPAEPEPAVVPETPAMPKGFVPMTQFDPQDIFIAGYPKSGNTWLQDLISGVIHGVFPEFAPPDVVQDLVPDIHASTYYKRYTTPMFFKTHAMPTPEYRKVVHLIRDGRDAMVSYFHHLSAMEGRPIDFLDAVKTGKYLFPCKWHEHTKAWLENPHKAHILLMRFEDLKTNNAAELQRLCDFAGIERPAHFIKLISDSAEFQKMRAKEARVGLGDPQWPQEKMFRRRGSVGSYKDEMPADVLEAFMSEAGETLRQCGYL